MVGTEVGSNNVSPHTHMFLCWVVIPHDVYDDTKQYPQGILPRSP